MKALDGLKMMLAKDPKDRFFTDNVHIWRSEKQGIVGLCISEYGRNDLFIEVLPEYHAIYPDIFRWIEDTWALNREEIEIDVYGAEKGRLTCCKPTVLHSRGILKTSELMIWRRLILAINWKKALT